MISVPAILDWPMWIAGFVFLVGGAAFGVGAVFALRPLVKRYYGEQHNFVFSNSFGAASTLFAIVAGLLVFAVVGAFGTASSRCASEAAALRQMYRNVQVFPEPQKTQAQDVIMQYTKSVIVDEFPTMADNEASPKTALAMDTMFGVIGTMTPDRSWSDQYSLVSEKMTDVVALRVGRVESSEPVLSPIYLLLLLFGATMTVLCLAMQYMENRTMHAIAVGAVAMALTSVLFLLVQVNNPYNGEISVKPHNFTTALAAMVAVGKP